MAGRNTRVQTEITYARPPHGGLFFYAKYFYSKRHIPPFSFPYNCKRKASGTNTSRKAKSVYTTRATAKAKSACTTLRAERKAARQSVEQIRLTVSGLVTANVQAHGSWVRARTDYARRSASCVKIVDCMNLFRISHASVQA